MRVVVGGQAGGGGPGAVTVEILGADGYDWGALAANLAIAVATIATLVWAIKTGRDEARRASRDRLEALAAQERRQATKISAWERQWDSPGDSGPTPRRVIYLHNASTAPVYDVMTRYVEALPTLADGSPGPRATWFNEILPPGIDPRTETVPARPGFAELSEIGVLEVEFRDAAGFYWLRDDDGILVRRPDLEELTIAQRWQRRHAEVGRDPSFGG